MKYYRLYGNARNLEKTGGNSMVNYYRLTLYIKIDGNIYPLTHESGFNGYTKKEIYSRLKSAIIEKMMNEYHIKTF